MNRFFIKRNGCRIVLYYADVSRVVWDYPRVDFILENGSLISITDLSEEEYNMFQGEKSSKINLNTGAKK
jgi:hypothetical protein